MSDSVTRTITVQITHTGVDNFAQALEKLSTVSDKIGDKIPRIVSSINSLKRLDAGIIANIRALAPELATLSRVVGGMSDGSVVATMGSNLNRLARGINNLASVPISTIGTISTLLKDLGVVLTGMPATTPLADIGRGLKGISASAMNASAIDSLRTALQNLGTTVASLPVPTILASYATNIQALIKGAVGLGAVSKSISAMGSSLTALNAMATPTGFFYRLFGGAPKAINLNVTVTSKTMADLKTLQANLSQILRTINQINGRRISPTVVSTPRGGTGATTGGATGGGYQQVHATNRALHFFQTALTTIGFTMFLGMIRESIDEFLELRSRIMLATDSLLEYNVAFEAINKTASDVRTSIGETSRLFNKFHISLKPFGATIEQTNAVVKVLEQSIKISGANTAEQKAFFVQFGQAIQSGLLRGREFRSMLESNLYMSRLLANELAGGNLGKLKEMAFAGQLDTLTITNAILRNQNKVNKDFANVKVTIADAFTLIKNELINVMMRWEKTISTSKIFVGTLMFIKNNLSKILAGATVFITVTMVKLLVQFRLLGKLMKTMGWTALLMIVTEIEERTHIIRNTFESIGKSLEKHRGKSDYLGGLDGIIQNLKTFFSTFDLETFIEVMKVAFQKFFNWLEMSFRNIMEDLGLAKSLSPAKFNIKQGWIFGDTKTTEAELSQLIKQLKEADKTIQNVRKAVWESNLTGNKGMDFAPNILKDLVPQLSAMEVMSNELRRAYDDIVAGFASGDFEISQSVMNQIDEINKLSMSYEDLDKTIRGYIGGANRKFLTEDQVAYLQSFLDTNIKTLTDLRAIYNYHNGKIGREHQNAVKEWNIQSKMGWDDEKIIFESRNKKLDEGFQNFLAGIKKEAEKVNIPEIISETLNTGWFTKYMDALVAETTLTWTPEFKIKPTQAMTEDLFNTEYFKKLIDKGYNETIQTSGVARQKAWEALDFKSYEDIDYQAIDKIVGQYESIYSGFFVNYMEALNKRDAMLEKIKSAGEKDNTNQMEDIVTGLESEMKNYSRLMFESVTTTPVELVRGVIGSNVSIVKGTADELSKAEKDLANIIVNMQNKIGIDTQGIVRAFAQATNMLFSAENMFQTLATMVATGGIQFEITNDFYGKIKNVDDITGEMMEKVRNNKSFEALFDVKEPDEFKKRLLSIVNILKYEEFQKMTTPMKFGQGMLDAFQGLYDEYSDIIGQVNGLTKQIFESFSDEANKFFLSLGYQFGDMKEQWREFAQAMLKDISDMTFKMMLFGENGLAKNIGLVKKPNANIFDEIAKQSINSLGTASVTTTAGVQAMGTSSLSSSAKIATLGTSALSSSGSLGSLSVSAGLASTALRSIAYSGFTKAQFGNPAEGGRPMWVGESGRELFIPEVNGHVYNNTASEAKSKSGYGSGAVNLTIVNLDDKNKLISTMNVPKNKRTVLNIVGEAMMRTTR